jgi:hypothetical protein
MSDRVAVYIDFDNVVISRYDNVHGDGAWRRDQAREHRRSLTSTDAVDVKLAEGEIDISAIIDYAASFGTVALARAYADWSVPANAAYKTPLVNRSIDLVQLFTTSGLKNGADIRLAVDAVEDLIQHADISHVVFVAGDSDYVPLAQRCKRLGRYVVGIGVAGSTSSALVSACNEFIDYADLPGVVPPMVTPPAAKTAVRAAPAAKARATKAAGTKAAARKAAVVAESAADAEATSLLVRAVRLGLQKSDDEWVYAGGVKSQMQRMNPAFKEKTLNFSTFRAFVESRSPAVESTVDANGQLMVRLP